MRATPLGMRLFKRPAAAAVVAGTTWDSANSSTDWALSNANRTANRTSTGGGFWAMLRGTSAKTNGTIVVTVDALGAGAFPAFIGFDTGVETQFPGQDGSGNSIGYEDTGAIRAGGGIIATVAGYTGSDIITGVKLGSTFTFKKNGTIVYGPTDLVGVLGAGYPVYGAAYPAGSTGNTTGTQLTLDASGW